MEFIAAPCGRKLIQGCGAAIAMAMALATVPAWGQSGSAATQPAATTSANATQTTSANQNNANSSADSQAVPPLAKPPKQGFWGHLWPFAGKGYVKTQLKPIRGQVNELDQLTSENGSDIRTMNSNLRAGVSRAQQTADQAGNTARQARQQVEQVSSRATQLDQQVATVNQNLQNADQYQVAQTAKLHFRPGVARLSSDTQAKLGQFLGNLQNQHNYLVEVEAYAPGRGLYAMENSQRLADTVVRYLVLRQQVPLYRIYTMGLGQAPVRASAQAARSRRRVTHGGQVVVRILQNQAMAQSDTGAGNPAGATTQQ
jgi:outer membrane protein OmpA-like peptidoglycan-associated protein